MGKGRPIRTKKNLVWSSEVSPDNQDDQGSSSSKYMISIIDCWGGGGGGGELGEDRGWGPRKAWM